MRSSLSWSRAGLVAGVVVLGVAFAYRPAAAEMMIDLYAGAAWTSDAKSSTNLSGSFLTSFPSAAGTNTKYGTSVEGGGRIGYWIDPLPWLGVALDASHFSPTGSFDLLAALYNPPEIGITPISALVMLRAPLLKSADFPNGRLQPYGAIGPSLVVASYEEKFFSAATFDSTSVAAGLDARAGLKVLFTDWMGMFLEYRYTYVSPQWRDNSTKISTQVSANHLLVGVGFHF